MFFIVTCTLLFVVHYFCFVTISRPPISTLFPYTTLFRSDVMHLEDDKRLQADLPREGRSVRALPKTEDCGKGRSEEHTSELQSLRHLVCRLLLEKKKNKE